MTKRKTTPKPLKSTGPAILPATPTPAPDPTRASLIRLLNGAEPASRSEKSLLFKWHHLSKWERFALAFAWGLPHPREEHERLARQAVEKLG